MCVRNIVLILVSILFSFTLKAQSLQSFGLKGKVKSIQQELKICPNRNGKAQTKECTSSTSEKQFSEDGFFIENENTLKNNGLIREKKEISTGILQTIYKEEDGIKRKWFEQYYNKEGVIFKAISFNDLHEVFSVYEYFYDDKGKMISSINEVNLNGIKERRVSYYDNYGTFYATEIYHNGEFHERNDFIVEYKFDKEGNWIYSYIDDKFCRYTYNRTITYY